MIMKRGLQILVVVSTMYIFTKCTQNPIFSDNIIPAANHWVRGQVMLSDSIIAKGAAVWMEGYELGAFTDDNGEFNILLPPGGSFQAGAENGIFRLFFYVGNYEIVCRYVVIIDGKVASNQGDVGLQGFLNDKVSLKKLLDIETHVQPLIISDGPDTLHCEVVLTPTENDTIQFLAQANRSYLFSAFLRSLDYPQAKIIKAQTASMLLNVFTIDKSELRMKLNIYIRPAELLGGRHEVIPFIILYQPYLPEGLKRLINYDFQSYNLAYLNIPYHRRGGQFEVIPTSQ